MSSSLKNSIALFPELPGIYKMYDEKETIIYVGKAKNLKKRVNSYFIASKNHSLKTQKMISHTKHIEYITVNTEEEALILETNYIKSQRPKYNILMKDDKQFVYLKIYTTWDFPKIEITRNLSKDKESYFGPFVSKSELESSLELLHKLYPLLSCQLRIKETTNGVICKGHEKYPCIEYQMQRCSAPCIGKISSHAYKQYIQHVIDFFKGNHENVLSFAQHKMLEASQRQNYEQALWYKQRIEHNRKKQEQYINSTKQESIDVIGIYHDNGKSFVSLFQIRYGNILANHHITMTHDGTYEETLTSFLVQYYEKVTHFPQKIFIPYEINDKQSIERLIQSYMKIPSHISLICPKKGERYQRIVLAQTDAKNYAENERAHWMYEHHKTEEAQASIISLISIPDINASLPFPQRMECYDISHYGGTSTVGSKIVFIDGEKTPKEYRHYHIQTLKNGEIDDFASLKEVIDRRLKEIHESTYFSQQSKKYEAKKQYERRTKKLTITLINHEKTYEIIAFKTAKNEICIHETMCNNEKISIENIESEALLCLQSIIPSYDVWGYSITPPLDIFSVRKTLHTQWKQGDHIIPEHLLDFFHQEHGCVVKAHIPKTKNISPIPDLILIDGGKGQLKSVMNVFESHGYVYNGRQYCKNQYCITLCSLAKKHEEVFFPYEKKPRVFPSTNQGNYLFQRMRDEAHRFAITFNKKIREKRIMEEPLLKIKGVGPAIEKKLLLHFGSKEKIIKSSFEDIQQVVGNKIATMIYNTLTSYKEEEASNDQV